MPSYKNTRFTLIALPQSVDNSGLLSLNIVFIPRNISPLEPVPLNYSGATPGGTAPPFVSVKPEFSIVVVNKPEEFPGKTPSPPNERLLDPASLVYPSDIQKLYQTLKTQYFDIDESRSVGQANQQIAPDPVAVASSVKKYLPLSYRRAFNFTGPRHPNAVIDDSYRCALREKKDLPPFVIDNKVSWGKVYAHLLRQQLLATCSGLLYQTTVQLADGDFAKGGWLYVTIKSGTTYDSELQASLPDDDGIFISRYAARMPMLKKGEARSLFASVLFPVMQPGKDPVGNWDDLYVEAARYNDGFTTIVHANQPVSQNLLEEEHDGFHPQKEMGIRLGWEDEQILVWYLRQLALDDTVKGGGRLDALLGVNGYHIDVRKSSDSSAKWESLTAVESNGAMMLGDIPIGTYTGELPFQVYPTKLDSAGGVNYWLPLYYGNWNDTSMVLPDRQAAELYANTQKDVEFPVPVSDTYRAVKIETRLQYGNSYDFRVRMSDISGGGPDANTSPAHDNPSHVATLPFRRYIAPNALRVLNTRYDKVEDRKSANDANGIVLNTGAANFSGDAFEIARPLLGFPAVVYTAKYTDPIKALQDSLKKIHEEQKGEAFGIPDPDVVKVDVKVEVETLQLDNLASDDGREHYITLYRTYRTFPADFAESLTIPVEYVDMPVLNFVDKYKPYNNDPLDATIKASSGNIVLPTTRNIRITFRAVCDGEGEYWGNIDNIDSDRDSRYGKKTVFSLRRQSKNEHALFSGINDPKVLQGIHLQPDPVSVKLNPIVFKTLQGNAESMPDIVQRLAKALDVECKDTTLLSENGERLQFWCSNLVRYSMAPDNSSVTFASRNELAGHWFVCTSLYLNRDWSWDALADTSFTISQRRMWGQEIEAEKTKTPNIEKSDAEILASTKEYSIAGDLELRRIASFQAIQADVEGTVHRDYTRIIFIDVIDMQPTLGQLPDTLAVQYSIEPSFRQDADNPAPESDGAFQTPELTLPTTVNPVQVPKLIGAGIALSPYVRDIVYSATEPRRRYLWLEFDSKPDDDHDDLFGRVLAYASDQLLSNNDPSLMVLPDEPTLPIDPEYVRVVTPESADEHSGLSAMQKLEKSIDKDRYFYLLPLPAGLYPESPELFGMYTYEFRYGHSDRIWSTAQGRFGRKLRVTGLQHPAPNLSCTVTRSEERICVSAPFAKAVDDGKNVTADPPRTSLWCLLYAQVRQADGLDFRNILLAHTELDLPDFREIQAMYRQRISSAQEQKDPEAVRNLERELLQMLSRDKEVGRHGYGCWSNAEVTSMLELYGLPLNAPLSVLCVEVYGQITRLSEHIDNISAAKMDELFRGVASVYGTITATEFSRSLSIQNAEVQNKERDPLGSELGHHRILRTSPLTPVPAICCSNCG